MMYLSASCPCYKHHANCDRVPEECVVELKNVQSYNLVSTEQGTTIESILVPQDDRSQHNCSKSYPEYQQGVKNHG